MQAVAPHSVNMIVTGFAQENDLVYVKLPQGKYKLGETIFMLPYNGGEQIIDLAEIDNLYRIHEESRLSGYKNLDSGDVITIEEFIKNKQILDKREYNSLEEENVWKTITDRHAYELYTAIWQPVRVSVSVCQKVEIHVEGQAPVADHPFIDPIRKISGDLTNTLYTYSKAGHIHRVVEFFLKKNGYRPLDQEPPNLGNPKDMDKTYYLRGELQYSKMFPSKDVGSKYITIEIPALKQYEKISGRNTGTFAELEALYNAVEKEITAIMQSYFNKHMALTSLTDETVGKVMSELEQLARNIRDIDSMKKTASDYNEACRRVDALIKTFRRAVADEL